MENRITANTTLLNEEGNIINPGYATSMLYEYNRDAIKANIMRIKEWDFYQVMIDDWVLKMTIGNISYVAECSADLFNVNTKELFSFSNLKLFPMSKIKLPLHPDEPSDLVVTGKHYEMCFTVHENKKVLKLTAQDKKIGEIHVDVTLHIDADHDKLVIATPFEKKRHFYLNCKENYFNCEGSIQFGSRVVKLNDQSTAVLDWGRGVWPFDQEWFWGNGSAFIDGHQFGFNIGWGFGNLNHASENIIYLDGKGIKLGKIIFEIDFKDYMKPWKLRDEDNRFVMEMTPVYDKIADTRLGIIQMYCHQLFGYYNGYVILEDGTKLVVENMLAFCEHAHNRW
ncbi:MAG: DUF2804 domain-containing protein [Clostridia bacterium]|nr:DUF2804 domain-containing protein [Clostridia bacterium]